MPVIKSPQNIAVIGVGINGLVAANYLVRAGHQVTGTPGYMCASELLRHMGQ